MKQRDSGCRYLKNTPKHTGPFDCLIDLAHGGESRYTLALVYLTTSDPSVLYETSRFWKAVLSTSPTPLAFSAVFRSVSLGNDDDTTAQPPDDTILNSDSSKTTPIAPNDQPTSLDSTLPDPVKSDMMQHILRVAERTLSVRLFRATIDLMRSMALAHFTLATRNDPSGRPCPSDTVWTERALDNWIDQAIVCVCDRMVPTPSNNPRPPAEPHFSLSHRWVETTFCLLCALLVLKATERLFQIGLMGYGPIWLVHVQHDWCPFLLVSLTHSLFLSLPLHRHWQSNNPISLETTTVYFSIVH
jgi:hypothetical protein